MSEYPVITNKYAAKAEFSGNIVNSLYTFEEIYCNDATILKKLKYDAETNKGVFDLSESYLSHIYTYGGHFNIKTSKADTVKIEGYDYLGQPIKCSVTTTSESLTNAPIVVMKYITKIEASSDVTVTCRKHSFGLPYKTTKILTLSKNGVDQTIASNNFSAPSLSKNTNGAENSRGSIFLNATTGDKIKAILVADNSLVTVDGEEVGGLYGNPSVLV